MIRRFAVPDYFYELRAAEKGFVNICGIDEAGRGPLAGPVCAAAVILPPGCDIPGLDDSKKLTEKKRESLFGIICEKAEAFSVAYASEREIDELNILNATFLAMQRACKGLAVKPDYALIDGNRMPKLDIPGESLVKGDSLSMSVAAASVLAKVSRDRLMLEIDKEYPEYAFYKHKGYGTKLHYERLARFGPSPVHRLTFLKKMH